jgi:phosphate transport system substrate-binding protein
MQRLWLMLTSDCPDRLQPEHASEVEVLERVLKQQRPPAARAFRRNTTGSHARDRFWPQTWREPVKHWTARIVTTAAAAGFIAAATTVPVRAADISGAGATFPYPIYAKWADAYKKVTGNGLNYQSIGSGGGIKQITNKTVTFGASDAPLKGDQLDKIGLAQFPTVMGGIVPVVNLAGIKPGELVIDGPTLAKIYLGEIKKWNDPALTKLNPSAKLPNSAIAVVHRSDGSGTTFNFAYYLTDVSADWKSKVGYNTSVQWPVGIGAKGNEGVANNVANTQGSMGYVEYAYALQNHLTYTKMKNKDGKVVSPTSAAFQAAAANANWKSQPGFGVILANQPGAQSWPMTAATFILVYKKPADPKGTAEALKFFAWCYKNGDKMAESLDYVPFPDSVVKQIEDMWKNDVKDASGKPVYSASL